MLCLLRFTDKETETWEVKLLALRHAECHGQTDDSDCNAWPVPDASDSATWEVHSTIIQVIRLVLMVLPMPAQKHWQKPSSQNSAWNWRESLPQPGSKHCPSSDPALFTASLLHLLQSLAVVFCCPPPSLLSHHQSLEDLRKIWEELLNFQEANCMKMQILKIKNNSLPAKMCLPSIWVTALWCSGDSVFTPHETGSSFSLRLQFLE